MTVTTKARPTDPTASPRAGALRWAALLALLVALLLPVSAQSALAQDGDTATITVTSFGEDGETPLPFARFQVTDSLGTVYPARETAPPDATTSFTVDVVDDTVTYTVAEETPPPCGIAPEPQEVSQLAAGETEALSFSTAFEDDCDLGAISIYSYTCPDGLDLTITDYAQYRDNCFTTNDGAEFTIAEADGDQEFDLTTGEFGIPGRAPLVGLEPGDYLLTERNNDSGLASLIYCLTFEGLPGEGSELVATDQKLPNADGEVELELDGGRIACDIFRVVGNLPANTGGGNSDEGDDADDSGDVRAQDEGDIIDEPSDEGEVVEDDGDAEGAGVEDPVSIEFHVATCPVEYDGPDYFNTCSANGTEGVTFDVVGQDTGATETSDPSAQPVAPGFAITTIADLPADTYTMTISVPGDFAEFFVYCADAPGGGPRVQTPSDDGFRFDIALASGQNVICDWYISPVNAQGLDPAVLRLTAFTCEPGYGGTSFAEVTAACTDATRGIAFNLASDNAPYDVDKTTNSDGKVRFLDLPPGDDYVLDEDLPGDALDDRIAFCAVNGGDYVEYAAGTGTIQLDPIAEGDAVQCLWYVIPTAQEPEPTATATSTPVPAEPAEPAEPGSLRIHKSECPPGQREDFFDDCYDDVVGGIGFNVAGGDGYDETGTTSNQGTVTFDDMPPGDYIVSELQPAEYRVDLYVVVCSRDGQLFETTYDDASGLRILLDLPEGADIVCDWYNVPPGAAPTPIPSATAVAGAGDDGTPSGSITVVKSLCELELEEIVNFADDCADYGDGADFTLTSVDDGDDDATGTTGTDSRIVFSGLADGAYALEETSGDWCKAQADQVDSDGNVLVRDGANTTVYIYNCLPDGKPVPGEPGGSDSPVKQLPSTGTGPAAETVERGVTLATWTAAALLATMALGIALATPALARRRRGR